ncbi:MAG: hypothetical protein HFE27_01395 [Clostridia bacterium]|jgi:hypothetical protein|nr:hypothetical protein [Clostridia bacterium]
MQNYRIEKRIPFGFRGDWGKLYKKYTYSDTTALEVVSLKKQSYADIGADVQFKPLDDGIASKKMPTEPLENRIKKSEYRIVQTTDAFFNDKKKEYECIVEIDDIVKVFGSYWIAESIDETCVYTPAKQSFYDIGLKIIEENFIEKEVK